MGKSDTALLRKELAKIVKESKIYQKKTDKIINELTNKLAQRDTENDLLRLALADRDRRIAFYENPHAPSSADSMYTAERAAFRKQMNEEDNDDDESGGGPESDDLRRKGPPKGHVSCRGWMQCVRHV